VGATLALHDNRKTPSVLKIVGTNSKNTIRKISFEALAKLDNQTDRILTFREKALHIDDRNLPKALDFAGGYYVPTLPTHWKSYLNIKAFDVKNGQWVGTVSALGAVGAIKDVQVDVDDLSGVRIKGIPIPNIRVSGIQLAPSIDLSDGTYCLGGTINVHNIDISLGEGVYQWVPIGGAQVELNRIIIKELQLTAAGKELEALLFNLNIFGRNLEVKHPAVSGQLSTPFSIQRATQKAELRDKLVLGEFTIEHASTAIQGAHYTEPSLQVDGASLNFCLVSASKSAASGSFSMRGLSFANSSAEISGNFSSGSLDASFTWQNNQLNGTGSMFVPAAVAHANIPVPIMKKGKCLNGDSNMSVKADGLLGDLRLQVSISNGDHIIRGNTAAELSASSSYYRCDYDVPFHVEAPKVHYSYPCVKHWRPQLCDGWTCVPACFSLSGAIRWRLQIQAIPTFVVAARDLELRAPNGKLKLCTIRPALMSTPLVLFDYNPITAISGDVGRFINDLISLGSGALETAVGAGVLIIGGTTFNLLGAFDIPIHLDC
jgi:hypothetical protein